MLDIVKVRSQRLQIKYHQIFCVITHVGVIVGVSDPKIETLT